MARGREFHEMRRVAEPEERHFFDRHLRDTPLFKLFMQFFGRYEPILDAAGRQ